MRVWFSGKMTAFQAVVGGSIPLTRTSTKKSASGAFFVRAGEASKLLCLREESKAGTCRFATVRRGREHLVDLESKTNKYT